MNFYEKLVVRYLFLSLYVNNKYITEAYLDQLSLIVIAAIHRAFRWKEHSDETIVLIFSSINFNNHFWE